MMKRLKIILVLSLLFLTAPLPHQTNASPEAVNFVDSGQSLGNAFSTGVEMGDLDGDGDQDAFVSNSGIEQNRVWVNQGGEQGGTEGVFQPDPQLLSDQTQRGLALGDLDGDVDLDVFLVRGISSDSLQVWINQGGEQGGTTGMFLQNGFIVNDNLSANVALGDVDGDGDLDAYLPRIFSPDQVYLNDGAGFFTNSGQSLELNDSLGGGLADLDGDGDLDIFSAVSDGPNSVWINQGGAQGGTEGVFQDSGQTLGNRISFNVALGDVDNDNDVDAFVANATENIVWVNQGGVQGGVEGVFQDNGQLLGFSGSLDVSLSDLDGDNDMDAFVAEGNANTVWVNQGGEQGGNPGEFADSGLALGNNFSSGVSLADVDRDGDPDAFIANSGPAPNKVYLNESAPPNEVNPEGWQIQVVEARGDTGYVPSLALDSDGRPHLAYSFHNFDSPVNFDRLIYTYWDGVRWQKEQVGSGGRIGGKISLALDAGDNPHIAFTTTGLNDPGLTYTYWDGTQWQMDIIESEDLDDNVSLALDSSGYPHVTYAYNGDNSELRYAAWDGAAWHIQTIEPVGFTFGSYTSFALDSEDHAHVAYFHSQEDALKYAFYDGSSWDIQTVDSDANFFGTDPFFSLTVDGNTPSIAYYADFGSDFYYTVLVEGSWDIQTIFQTPLFSNITGELSLKIDTIGNPHIAYNYDQNNVGISLQYIFWDGAQWNNEIMDNSANFRDWTTLALDADNRPHFGFQDSTFKDLRYISWAPDWQIRTLPDAGSIAAADLQVRGTIPYLGYHNLGNGFVNLASWDDRWRFDPVDSVSSPVTQVSLVVSPNRRHLSYYDADAKDLWYGNQDEFGWDMTVVDSQGDVGRYNQTLLGGDFDAFVRIAYWDETNRRIKLAVYDLSSDTFQLLENTAGPILSAGSGPLSATMLREGDIGIAYYDAGQTGLRFAVWDAETGNWTDELVEGAGGDMGRLNTVQTDGICGCAVIAYYDETNRSIKYGYRDSGGWHLETVIPNPTGLTSMSLELGFASKEYPRIVFTAANGAHFAQKVNGLWEFETIAEGLNNPAAAALALDVRPHLAYMDDLDGLQYVFRTATLDVDTTVPGPQTRTSSEYLPISPCILIFNFYFPFENETQSVTKHPVPAVGDGGLDDLAIFQSMSAVFQGTDGGRYYRDLYADHAVELGQVGLDDPALLWDAYGTLQNFLPGLEALVKGQGSQVVLTETMLADALDIWTRIAAVASPELTNVIQGELDKYNDLQDFLGMTFDEWASAIGVHPPGNSVFLPLIRNQ